MSDPSTVGPASNGVTGPDGPPGVPRWVKVAGLIVGLIALVTVVLMLMGGNHGPGRHKMGSPPSTSLDSSASLAEAPGRFAG